MKGAERGAKTKLGPPHRLTAPSRHGTALQDVRSPPAQTTPQLAPPYPPYSDTDVGSARLSARNVTVSRKRFARFFRREIHALPAALRFLALEIAEDRVKVIVEGPRILVANLPDFFEDHPEPCASLHELFRRAELSAVRSRLPDNSHSGGVPERVKATRSRPKGSIPAHGVQVQPDRLFAGRAAPRLRLGSEWVLGFAALRTGPLRRGEGGSTGAGPDGSDRPGRGKRSLLRGAPRRALREGWHCPLQQ